MIFLHVTDFLSAKKINQIICINCSFLQTKKAVELDVIKLILKTHNELELKL